MTALEFVITKLSAPPSGCILELGVGNGTSLRQAVAAAAGTRNVFGFDWFGGLPEDWTPWFPKGTFAQDKVPEVDGACIWPGLFAESLPTWFMSSRRQVVAILHVDCDLYRSAMQALCLLNWLIVPGTIMVFDEFRNQQGYEWHEQKALNDWLNLFGRQVEPVEFEDDTDDAKFRAVFRVVV